MKGKPSWGEVEEDPMAVMVIDRLERELQESEAKITKIKRILAEPIPFGAVEEQLDQIREVVSGKQIKGGN